MPRLRSPQTLAFMTLCAGILGFYLWTASEGRAFPLGTPQDAHYNLLAQALVRGQLHLPVAPRPQLLELLDPYDPAKNAPYRLHDASLYQGRYYLYYGVVPALALFVPCRLLGFDLPEGLATAAFAFGAFAFSGLVLWRLVRGCAPTSPFPLRLLALLVLGLTNGMPFLLRGAAVYEVAIAAGACFLWAAAFFLATSGEGERTRLTRLCLGSLCLGLAVGCRPSHVFSAPLLLALAWAPSPAGVERRGKAVAAALGPLALVLVLLAGYNVARFSSPFEFGTRYQLSGNHPHGLLWLDPRAILPGLYFNFLAPPDLRPDFPFVFLERRYPWALPPGYFGPELIAGVFLLAPFVLILLAARRWVPPEPPPGRGRFTLALLVAVGLWNPLVTSFLIGAANQRYEADFVSFLVAPALVVWLSARERFASRSKSRRRLALGMALAMGWAVAAALALSLTGYEDSLRQGNPALFHRIERAFEPLRVPLGRLLMRDARATVRFRMALPDRPSAEVEPLVSSGSPARQDVLSVRTLGPGLVSFVVGPIGSEHASAPVPLRTGHFHAVEVDLDRVLRHVLVRIDGHDPLRIEAPLGPVVAGQVWLGRGARGKDAPDLGRFSGALVTEVMDWARAEGSRPLPDIAPSPTEWSEASAPPEVGASGQLWASAAREGAFLHDGREWRWIARPAFDRVQVTRTLTLSSGAVGHDQPVLSSGTARSADLVSVRLSDPGHVVFSYGRWPAGSTTKGPAIPFLPGPLEVTVLLERPAGRVRVTVAGRTALDASADLLPIERNGLSVGRLP